MKVLITGGLGFIGRALSTRLLKEHNHELVLIDSLNEQIHGPTPDYSEILNYPNVQFIQANICTPGVLRDALNAVDLVYHLAAETGTGQSMYEIQTYYRTNVMGTAILLEELVKNPRLRPKHFVLASSRSVYGEGPYVRAAEADQVDGHRLFPGARHPEDMRVGRFDLYQDGEPLVSVPALETDPPNPKSLYAASKLAQEHMCQIACASMGVRFTALRLQNVYGPGQSLRNPYTGILSIFINTLRQGGIIDVFEDGQESRDFVFIEDVVSAFVAAPRRLASSDNIINIGCGVRTSVSEIVDLLQSKMGLTGRARISGRFRPGDVRHCYADTNRMRELLGLLHTTCLADGLAATVDWAQSQAAEKDLSEVANKELVSFLSSSK